MPIIGEVHRGSYSHQELEMSKLGRPVLAVCNTGRQSFGLRCSNAYKVTVELGALILLAHHALWRELAGWSSAGVEEGKRNRGQGAIYYLAVATNRAWIIQALFVAIDLCVL